MATRMVELSEAGDDLAELVAQAASGTEVVLTEGHTPRARLGAVAGDSTRRGGWLPWRQTAHGGCLVCTPPAWQPPKTSMHRCRMSSGRELREAPPRHAYLHR